MTRKRTKTTRPHIQDAFVYITNRNHPWYGYDRTFSIHFRTNAGFMVRHPTTFEWDSIPEIDCYAMAAA